MFRIGRLASRMAAAVIVAAIALPAGAAEFDTPEATVTAYLEGFAAGDFDQMLAATAVEETSDGFNFVKFVDWLKAITLMTPAPAGEAFFDDINAAQFTGAIAGQAKILAYALMTTSTVVEGSVEMMDGPAAALFAEQLSTARLGKLELLEIGLPAPELFNTPVNLANFDRNAKLFGADEATDRVALITFEGNYFIVGFNLFRYGESWKIRSQNSPIAGTSALGAPMPTTPEEFAELIR